MRVPCIMPVKPLLPQQLDIILSSSKTTEKQKQLVYEVKGKIKNISEKHGIDKSRLFPIIDFEYNTTSVWFD